MSVANNSKVNPICCGKDMQLIYRASKRRVAGWHCWTCNKFKKAGPLGGFVDLDGVFVGADISINDHNISA